MTVSLTQDTDKGPSGGSSGVLGSVQHTLKEPSNGQNDPLTVQLYCYTMVAVTLDASGTLSLSPAHGQVPRLGAQMYSASAMVDRAIRITSGWCPLTLVRVVGPVAIGEMHRADGVVTCALDTPEEYPGCREMGRWPQRNGCFRNRNAAKSMRKFMWRLWGRIGWHLS